MNKQNKCTTWNMRSSQNDKVQIATLAKRLGVKESKAVRMAVVFLLAELPIKTVKSGKT